jgi:hypothetical protein
MDIIVTALKAERNQLERQPKSEERTERLKHLRLPISARQFVMRQGKRSRTAVLS